MLRRCVARRKGYAYSPKGTVEDYTGSFRHSFVGAKGVQDGSIPPGMSPDEFSKLREFSGDREGFGGMPDAPRRPHPDRGVDPRMDVRWGEATEAEAGAAAQQPDNDDKAEWAFKGSDAFGGPPRHRVHPTSEQLREAGLLEPQDDPLLGPKHGPRRAPLGPVYYALLSGIVVTVGFMAKFGQ
jgi:hypothetical protein